MVLSDHTIKDLLAKGELHISPLEERQIQPASVDIRIGNTFSVVEDDSDGILRLDKEIHYRTIQSEKSRAVCFGNDDGVF